MTNAVFTTPYYGGHMPPPPTWVSLSGLNRVNIQNKATKLATHILYGCNTYIPHTYSAQAASSIMPVVALPASA